MLRARNLNLPVWRVYYIVMDTCIQNKLSKLGCVMVEVCTGIQTEEWPFIVGTGEDSRYFIDSL